MIKQQNIRIRASKKKTPTKKIPKFVGFKEAKQSKPVVLTPTNHSIIIQSNDFSTQICTKYQKIKSWVW